jgi:hypothetical protein
VPLKHHALAAEIDHRDGAGVSGGHSFKACAIRVSF